MSDVRDWMRAMLSERDWLKAENAQLRQAAEAAESGDEDVCPAHRRRTYGALCLDCLDEAREALARVTA